MKSLSVLLALLASAFLSNPANAQAACAERQELLASLAEEHSEVPVGRGLASNGTLVEVLAAEQGSFTVLITPPGGPSCVITVGQYWENFSPSEREKLAGDLTAFE